MHELATIHLLVEDSNPDSKIQSYKPLMSGDADKSKLYLWRVAGKCSDTLPEHATGDTECVTCPKCIATTEFVELMLKQSPRRLSATLESNIKRAMNEANAAKTIAWLKSAYEESQATADEEIQLPDLGKKAGGSPPGEGPIETLDPAKVASERKGRKSAEEQQV